MKMIRYLKITEGDKKKSMSILGSQMAWRVKECVRYGNIDDNEVHVCFFCGADIKVTVNHCGVCRFGICESCGKCACSLSESEINTLGLIYKKYCQDKKELKSFVRVTGIEGEKNIIDNMNKCLLRCSSYMRENE